MNFYEYEQLFYTVLKQHLDNAKDELSAIMSTVYRLGKEYPLESNKYIHIISETIDKNFPRNGRAL